MAFYGLPLGRGRPDPDACVGICVELARADAAGAAAGAGLDLVPSDGTGQIDVAALERMIGPRTQVIALTHVPTQGGLVNPAEEVGRVARAHGLIYLLDACQSVGQIAARRRADRLRRPVGDRAEVPARAAGHGLSLRLARDGRADRAAVRRPAGDDWTGAGRAMSWRRTARRFENWESYVAGRLGLAAAVRYARRVGLAGDRGAGDALGARLREALAARPGVTVHDRGRAALRDRELPRSRARRRRRRRGGWRARGSTSR